MFGSHFELTADMIFDQLLKEALVPILKQIVIPYTRTYKNLFDLRQLAQGAQDIKIFLMVGFKSRTGLGRKTFFALAQSPFKLTAARRRSEVRSRSADIMYISLKSGVFSELLRLSDY